MLDWGKASPLLCESLCSSVTIDAHTTSRSNSAVGQRLEKMLSRGRAHCPAPNREVGLLQGPYMRKEQILSEPFDRQCCSCPD